MHMDSKIVGAGVAAAIAAGLGYALLSGGDDETQFDMVAREGAFSVRDYPRLVVAETVQYGTRETALSRGFLALSDYVFGKDRAGVRLPVTPPVFSDGDEDGRGWRTRFVIPASMAADELPHPGEGIRIRALGPRRVAALRFSGETHDHELALREEDLRRWLGAQGRTASGPVEHAYYSSPFMPGLLRRNEVLIPLAA